MGDWADEKAADVIHLVLKPEVPLDDVAVIIAENFRLIAALGAEDKLAILKGGRQ